MTNSRADEAELHSRALNNRFAAIQQWGSRIALAVMLATFALYASGVIRPYVPLDRLPGLLREGAATYASAQSIPLGWAWLSRLDHGDMLSLAGLVVLIGVTIVAYVGQLPLLLRRRDWIYVVMLVLQLLVFAVAAGLVSLPG